MHDAGCVMKTVRGRWKRWRAHLPFRSLGLATRCIPVNRLHWYRHNVPRCKIMMNSKQIFEKIRSWTRRSALLSAADSALSRLRSTEGSQPSWWFVRDGVTPEPPSLVAKRRDLASEYTIGLGFVICTRYVNVYIYQDVSPG